MREQPVVFKGTRKGLNVYIDNKSDISQILELAAEKLESGKPFFEGATVNLSFVGREFESSEQSQLLELFSRYMKPGNVEFQVQLSSETGMDKPATDYYQSFNGIDEGMTRFIRGTVRSGQRIFYEGNIVIIGDVNPGGEVISGGNILRWYFGALPMRATGNQEALVASYCLQPTQLRIAGYIARAPEGETENHLIRRLPT